MEGIWKGPNWCSSTLGIPVLPCWRPSSRRWFSPDRLQLRWSNGSVTSGKRQRSPTSRHNHSARSLSSWQCMINVLLTSLLPAGHTLLIRRWRVACTAPHLPAQSLFSVRPYTFPERWKRNWGTKWIYIADRAFTPAVQSTHRFMMHRNVGWLVQHMQFFCKCLDCQTITIRLSGYID